MRIFPFILLFLFIIQACDAKKDKQNKAEIEAIFIGADFEEDFEKIAHDFKAKDSSQHNLLATAKLFLDTAYVGKTLEVGNDSLPVLNLRQLDCLTYVENTMALEMSQGDRDSFISTIAEIRYKNGIPRGYASRLHYFSAWILDNEQKGLIEDVTCQIGGEPIQFHTNFMSENPQYYPQLVQDSTLIDKIKKMENAIHTTKFCYLPKSRMSEFEDSIRDGDIFGITTNIQGLDFAHNGMAIHKSGRLYMIHASSDYKKVMITHEPLADYLMKMKHMTGLVVLRLRH